MKKEEVVEKMRFFLSTSINYLADIKEVEELTEQEVVDYTDYLIQLGKLMKTFYYYYLTKDE
jgi:hypothetical protein